MANFFGSLPSVALFFMALFLYGKHFHWKKFKETRIYFIKETVAIALAVIFKKLFIFLNSIPDMSRDFADSLEVILTLMVGIIWYIEYKRIRKLLPAKTKPQILKVDFKDGYWECPSCKKKNKEKYNFCEDCGQEIELPKQ